MICINYVKDSYQCGLSVDGVREELDILDTAGQDQFEALQDHCYVSLFDI